MTMLLMLAQAILSDTNSNTLEAALPKANLGIVTLDSGQKPMISIRCLIKVPSHFRESSIFDFEMERCQVDYQDRQIGNWKPVDKSKLFDVLNSAKQFAPDVVPEEIRSAITTCPIPFQIRESNLPLLSHTSLVEHADPTQKRILFRYFDFDLKEGDAFRYRVRFKYVLDGNTKETNWSAATIPTGWKPAQKKQDRTRQ